MSASPPTIGIVLERLVRLHGILVPLAVARDALAEHESLFVRKALPHVFEMLDLVFDGCRSLRQRSRMAIHFAGADLRVADEELGIFRSLRDSQRRELPPPFDRARFLRPSGTACSPTRSGAAGLSSRERSAAEGPSMHWRLHLDAFPLVAHADARRFERKRRRHQLATRDLGGAAAAIHRGPSRRTCFEHRP